MRFYWNECVSHLINTRNNSLSSTRRRRLTHLHTHNHREPISFQIRINYMPVTFFGRAPTTHCASGNMLGISILTRRERDDGPTNNSHNNKTIIIIIRLHFIRPVRTCVVYLLTHAPYLRANLRSRSRTCTCKHTRARAFGGMRACSRALRLRPLQARARRRS